MTRSVTAETLAAERERRWKERQKIADTYDAAADALIAADQFKHRSVIAHLRVEALNWRSR